MISESEEGRTRLLRGVEGWHKVVRIGVLVGRKFEK
jgi:hypothetical protein